MVQRWGFGGFCAAIHLRVAAMIPFQQRKDARRRVAEPSDIEQKT
jgi:hypothetical protein